MLPDPLEWVLEMLGFNWPTADEDKLIECAQVWRQFAAEVQGHQARGTTYANNVLGENYGDSIDGFSKTWEKFSGGSGYFDDAQQAAEVIAFTFEAAAVLVIGMKVAVIVQLAILAAEIIAAQAAAPFTLGLSEIGGAAATLATREMVRSILKEVAKQLLDAIMEAAKEPVISALEAMVSDLIAQTVNQNFGAQKGYDLSRTAKEGYKAGKDALENTGESLGEGLRDGAGHRAGHRARGGLDSAAGHGNDGGGPGDGDGRSSGSRGGDASRNGADGGGSGGNANGAVASGDGSAGGGTGSGASGGAGDSGGGSHTGGGSAGGSGSAGHSSAGASGGGAGTGANSATSSGSSTPGGSTPDAGPDRSSPGPGSTAPDGDRAAPQAQPLPPPDQRSPFDEGYSGNTPDTSPTPDSGTTPDAGSTPDSGASPGPGAAQDSGPAPDSGTTPDSGATPDGSRPDPDTVSTQPTADNTPDSARPDTDQVSTQPAPDNTPDSARPDTDQVSTQPTPGPSPHPDSAPTPDSGPGPGPGPDQSHPTPSRPDTPAPDSPSQPDAAPPSQSSPSEPIAGNPPTADTPTNNGDATNNGNNGNNGDDNNSGGGRGSIPHANVPSQGAPVQHSPSSGPPVQQRDPAPGDPMPTVDDDAADPAVRTQSADTMTAPPPSALADQNNAPGNTPNSPQQAPQSSPQAAGPVMGAPGMAPQGTPTPTAAPPRGSTTPSAGNPPNRRPDGSQAIHDATQHRTPDRPAYNPRLDGPRQDRTARPHNPRLDGPLQRETARPHNPRLDGPLRDGPPAPQSSRVVNGPRSAEPSAPAQSPIDRGRPSDPSGRPQTPRPPGDDPTPQGGEQPQHGQQPPHQQVPALEQELSPQEEPASSQDSSPLTSIRDDLDHHPGGLLPPDPNDQQLLRDAHPTNPDGTPQRFADPFAPWGQLQNDGGNTVPGRSNNCADCSRSFLETWYGNPQVSAPRTPDSDENGHPDTWSPESDANDNQIRWSGAAHTYAGAGSDPNTPARIAYDLQQAGHGAAAIVQVDWPDDGGGHAFNAVNHHGQIIWVDTQTGQVSTDPLHISQAENVWHIPLDANRQPLHADQAVAETGDSATDGAESPPDGTSTDQPESKPEESPTGQAAPHSNSPTGHAAPHLDGSPTDTQRPDTFPGDRDGTPRGHSADSSRHIANALRGDNHQLIYGKPAPNASTGEPSPHEQRQQHSASEPNTSHSPEPSEADSAAPSADRPADEHGRDQNPDRDAANPPAEPNPDRASDDAPAPAADTRPYDVDPGGVRRPGPADQHALNNSVPRDADGTPQRHPDPNDGDWLNNVNGQNRDEPGRANNCADAALSFADTYSGHPTAAAPRTPDLNPDGTPSDRGEKGGRDRIENTLGSRFHDYGDGHDAYHRVEDTLRREGHGSQAVIVTTDSAGRAHAWNAVNHNGNITYVDPQTGARSNKPLYDGSHGVHAIPLTPDRQPTADASAHKPDVDGERRPADPAGTGPDDTERKKEIRRKQLARANEKGGKWFKEYYQKNGHRKRILKEDENGNTVPQLHPTSDPDTPWMLASDVPDPDPETYIDSGEHRRSREENISEDDLKRLDKSAEKRKNAILADNQPHKDRATAKEAYENDKTPENKKKFEELDKAHSPLHGKMGRASEAYGEDVAEYHAMPEHFPNATRVDDRGSGNNRFDQIWHQPGKDPEFIVVEAKGSTEAGLGTRQGLPSPEAPDQPRGDTEDGAAQDAPRPGVPLVKQGTREYFKVILHEMESRAARNLIAASKEPDPAKAQALERAAEAEQQLAQDLDDALMDEEKIKVKYVLVKGNADGERHNGYEMKEFEVRTKKQKEMDEKREAEQMEAGENG
ncbi:toxin glutamine deamidase domain-containing protein [Streptomyces sp. NPDC093589]|uniref:toxin glutamine deamidase domain-containing protein n=1 Tax=Streptomyces sp. NPDC093589 TaxID=3366043 RepID=UPI0037FF6BBB